MASIPKSVTLWKYRRIPYIFEDGYPHKDEVRKAMDDWQDAAGVSFQPRASEANYLVIKHSSTGSSSSVGMKIGPQDMNLNDGYKSLHELGHTLGLIHEQQRSDRDTYIDIQWDNIEEARKHNFKLEDTSKNLTKYDQKSVMHYPSPTIGWGGYPPNQEVWTMRWKLNKDAKLGPESWRELSDLDKIGLREAYENVPVPMGENIAGGCWELFYEVQFPFTVGGRQFLYGQNMNEKHWFIREIISPRTIRRKETDKGKLPLFYEVQFPFTIEGRQFFYGQNMDEKRWFIRELLPDGKMEEETDKGKWNFSYEVQFPFTIEGRQFFYGQNMGEKNWFIRELLPGGKMGEETAKGEWNFSYEVQFPFTVGGRQFFYGQNMDEKRWFIQELSLSEGKIEIEGTDYGRWNNAYAVQFPYNIMGNQYFFGQNLDSGYWFIQRLNSDGKMGDEIQSGFWKYRYAVQFPFQIENEQYFYRQITNDLGWFIRKLENV